MHGGHIHGGIARETRRASIAAFNSDPVVRVMIANDAAGEGVNLQRGAHLMVKSIFGSLIGLQSQIEDLQRQSAEMKALITAADGRGDNEQSTGDY